MGKRPSREKRRKKEDPLWFKYKKPTSKRIFYHTFQKNALSAGNPPAIIIGKKNLNAKVAEFVKTFTKVEAFDLVYLESLLPIRYCYLLPRNYAVLLFALYLNGIAETNEWSFLDCFKSIKFVNEYFEKHESPEKYYDTYLLNSDFKNEFENTFFNDSKIGIYYIINAEIECPSISQRIDVILLFDLRIFRDPTHKFHAFMNFPTGHSQKIPEGIAFFKDKKNLQDEQNAELFYRTGENAVSHTVIQWKPHADINEAKWQSAKRRFKKFYEIEVILTYRDAKKLIYRSNPKILQKLEYKNFIESLKERGIKKSADDLTRDFKIYLPHEKITILNYFLLLDLVPSFLKGYTSRTGENLPQWRMSRTYPLETTAYSVIKRHLFLYNLVGPFRTILGLPKRKKQKKKVEFITPQPNHEIPSETHDILKNYATPSQVLLNIVENSKQNQGDVEASLKYIRGVYRTSRKVSLMLKNKQHDLIPKVVAHYL